jgi:tetratricopeptide (TPR) repeat protein
MSFTRSIKTRKERGIGRALSLFFAMFLTVSTVSGIAQAAKPLTPEQISVYQSATEADRVHFLIGRAKSGQYELAELLLHKFPLQGPHSTNRTLYIEGIILAKRGDLTGAAAKYRAALANDPKLTLVRSELALTLAALDEDDSAKHHLQLLEADAPNENAAQGIRSFIDQIDAKRPVTFSGYLSLAPSTNINNGSNHSNVSSTNPNFKDNPNLEIIDNSRKQSGVGVDAGASVGYTTRLGNHWEAVLAADIGGQVYDNKDYNSLALSQSAEMRYHFTNGYLGLGGIADQSFNPNGPDLIQNSMTRHSFGPRVSLKYFLGQRDQINASVVYEWRDSANSTMNDAIDYRGEVSWSHAIDSSLNLSLSGGYEKLNANTSFISYGTAFAGLNVYKELPLGITVNANSQVRYAAFDDVNPSFPDKVREDYRYTGGVTLTKRDFNIMGFAPSLSYSYTRNFSNIVVWDYDAHNVDFRLTKDF